MECPGTSPLLLTGFQPAGQVWGQLREGRVRSRCLGGLHDHSWNCPPPCCLLPTSAPVFLCPLFTFITLSVHCHVPNIQEGILTLQMKHVLLALEDGRLEDFLQTTVLITAQGSYKLQSQRRVALPAGEEPPASPKASLIFPLLSTLEFLSHLH